jgi:hypothetical protein
MSAVIVYIKFYLADARVVSNMAAKSTTPYTTKHTLLKDTARCLSDLVSYLANYKSVFSLYVALPTTPALC